MKKFLRLILLVAFCIGLVLIARKIWWKMHPLATQYYGVFLANGQVYFGHIQKTDKTTITLSDVYYLQANQPISEWTEETSQAQIDLQVALIKLGNEIHGPQDFMYIERNQVLFYEPLREDGRVVQAIRNYQP